MIHADQRFPTNNTNLAACLGALRIPIKQTDPVWDVREPENNNKRVVTFFFEMASKPLEENQQPEESRKVDWAWRNRAQFETDNPKHPLVPMRKGLDALDWLTKVYYGAISPTPRAGVASFSTSDITLAACFKASGHELHSFVKPEFRFSVTDSERDRICEQFENFRSEDGPVSYMRRAIEAKSELIALVKRAPKILHYVNGDPMEGGKEGFIAQGISEKKLNQFFDLLYDDI
jgi:hypothetical protein